jgi:hypothetical protein
MSSNTEKELLLDQYIKGYTPENRLGFIKLVLTKYKLSDNNIKFEDLIVQDTNIRNIANNIKFEDLIVQDTNIRNIANNIIKQKSCTPDNFKKVFNMLNIDQIYYIGF